MKKLIYTALLTILFAFSCKKGEDDPAFTLLSRKARVAGEWKMTEGSITVGIKNSSKSYEAFKYVLKANSFNMDVIGNGAPFSGAFSLSLSFKKDGTFNITQKMDSVNFDGSGVWDFQGRVGYYKNKEVMFIRLNRINGYSNRIDLFNKAFPHFKYRIKELRGKKMVLVCDEEMIEFVEGGNAYYVTAEYILTQ